MNYDIDGNATSVATDSNSQLETLHYTNGQVDRVSVALGANSVTGLIGYDGLGVQSSISWQFPSGQNAVSDSVIRSQAGHILQDTLTDGSTSYGSTFSYDAAGRLVTAAIPQNVLTYSYGTSSCGADSNAGADGNRTSTTDSLNGAVPTTTAYCYDNADRLTGTSVTNAPSNADSLESGNLSSSGAGANLAYDAHGNVTRLGTETLAYDEDDRHVSTATADGASVTYQRDANDSIVGMTTTTSSGSATTVRFSSDGGIDWTMSSAGSVQEETLSLAGGVSISLRPGASTIASFDNLQGAATVLTDGSGLRQGSISLYDPFGNPEDLVSGQIGTTTADGDVPVDTTTPGTTRGWAAGADKETNTALPIQAIEMGARQYVPLLGRFLSVDPVPGGNENDYSYANDPVDESDYSGDFVPMFDDLPNYIDPAAAHADKVMRAVYAAGQAHYSTEQVVARDAPEVVRAVVRARSQESRVREAAKSRAEARERSLDGEANILNTVSTVTGILAFIPVLTPIMLPISIVTGVAGAVIDCRHGVNVSCVTDAVSVVTGTAGPLLKGLSVVRSAGGLSDLSETTQGIADHAGGAVSVMGGSFGNIVGWGTFARSN